MSRHVKTYVHTHDSCLPAIDENVALIIDEMVNALTMTKTKLRAICSCLFLHPNFLKKGSLNDWLFNRNFCYMEESLRAKRFFGMCV